MPLHSFGHPALDTMIDAFADDLKGSLKIDEFGHPGLPHQVGSPLGWVNGLWQICAHRTASMLLEEW